MTGPFETSFTPRKRFGQHFLVNERITEKIIHHCHLSEDLHVLEIGPGQGALTTHLAPRVRQLTAVEKDRDLATYLRNVHAGNPSVTIVNEDFLGYDLDSVKEGLVAVGNLPYNVATPIIEKIIQHQEKFQRGVFMVQWEHARRMTAQPHSKDYGSLTCFIQYHADVRLLFKIRPSAFNPPPKVDSAIIEFQIRDEPQRPALDETFLFLFIRTAFQQRRKKLINACEALVEKGILEDFLLRCDIPVKVRAEDVALDEYVRLTNMIRKEGKDSEAATT